jgi:diacylglycerol kinase family enzyme
MFTGRYLRDPRVTYLTGRTVEIVTAGPIPIHLDGDPAGQTPVRLEVLPGAIRVLAPEPQPRSLFIRRPLKLL